MKKKTNTRRIVTNDIKKVAFNVTNRAHKRTDLDNWSKIHEAFLDGYKYAARQSRNGKRL